jgi:hypothetical protein
MSRAAGRESEPLFAVKGLLALRRHHALQLVPRRGSIGKEQRGDLALRFQRQPCASHREMNHELIVIFQANLIGVPLYGDKCSA